MEVYKVCFSTQHHDGGRIFHDSIVLVRKVKGHNLYKVKWDFSGGLNDPLNPTVTIHATDAVKAIKEFIGVELVFDPSVDVIGWSKIKL